MAVVITAVITLIIAGTFWYIWNRYYNWRRRVRRETEEVDTALHTIFDLLREDIFEQLDFIEKARDNEQIQEMDENIRRHITDSLQTAQTYIRKELEDVEKEV